MNRVYLNQVVEKPISGEWGKDDATGNGIPVLRTTNFTNDGVIAFDNVVTRDIPSEKLKGKWIKNGDIIIEKSGGSDKQPVGRVVYFDGESDTYTFNNFTSVLRVHDSNCWDSKYVFYVLFHNYLCGGTRAYENKTTGIHNLKLDMYLKKFSLQERCMQEQRQIVKTLDKIIALIELRKKQLIYFDDLVKSRFIEMFGDLRGNPYKWPVKTFKDMTELITDGEHATPVRTDQGIYLLSARNVLNHRFNLDDVDYISAREYDRISSRVIPQEGDVLISCSGTIGRCCTVPAGLKFQMVRSVALLRFKKEIEPKFAEYLIASSDLQRQIDRSKTTSTQANLFQGKISKLQGFIPPKELQKQFVSIIEKIDKSKLAIQKSLDELETLKKSLMQEYFG